MEIYSGKSVNGVPFDENGNVEVSGISGTSGTSGESGTSGTSGGNGTSGTSGAIVDTAFQVLTYADTMEVAYDNLQPNFEINLTGDLDLTITGTANGDSGLVNLYFSGNEVAVLNGLTSLIITGAGEMVACCFEHDTNGLRWSNQVNPQLFALKNGTILHHIAVATNAGTFSNVGNVCTGVGTAITAQMIGAQIIKANGEEGIIATRTSDTEFTTEIPFLTDSADTSFEVKCIAYKIKPDGSTDSFDFEGYLVSRINIYGGLDMLGLQLRKNGNAFSYGFLFQHGVLQFYNYGNIVTNYPSYASEALAIADGDLLSGMGFKVTGSNIVYTKP